MTSTFSGHIGKHIKATTKTEVHTKRYGQVEAVRRHPGNSTEPTNLRSRKLPNEMLAGSFSGVTFSIPTCVLLPGEKEDN